MGCCPQHFLEVWVLSCLIVGWLLIFGGAHAAGAAMLGSAAGALVALPFSWHNGLESLVHGVIIGASVGAVVFGLAGLAWGADAPIDRYLKALALVPAVVGTLLIVRVHARAGQTCYIRFTRPNQPARVQAVSCFRGFEDTWVQALLAFNFAFFALLFLLQGRRSSEEDANRNRSVASPGEAAF